MAGSSVGLRAVTSAPASPAVGAAGPVHWRRRRRRKMPRTGLLFYLLLEDPDSRIISSLQNCFSLFSRRHTKCRCSPRLKLCLFPPLYRNSWFLSIFMLLVKVKLSQYLLGFPASCRPLDSPCSVGPSSPLLVACWPARKRAAAGPEPGLAAAQGRWLWPGCVVYR